MARAEVKAIKAKLLKDPAYREAWDAVLQAVEQDRRDKVFSKPEIPSHAGGALCNYLRLLDDRPDLRRIIDEGYESGFIK